MRFLTAVVEGTTVRMYVDGEFWVQAVNENAVIPFDKVGMRGRYDDASNNSMHPFRQFKLFRKALTPDEVAALYAEELAVLNAAAAGATI